MAKGATSGKAATEKSAGLKSAKKSAVKKSAAKKSAVKKSAVKKSAAKKSAAKKSAVKKSAAKKSVKKTSSRKAVAKKKPTKKRSAKHKPTTITRRVSRKRPNRRAKRAKPLIGWREWVVLPEFTDTPIKAKVDSGAVTSSIHAFNLQISTDGGQTTARFGVAPKQGSHAAKTTVEHPIVGFKKVRSSNGQAELRPVIRTVAVIGEENFEIDITLASRDAMGFRMLLGRRAVRNRFVIDPGRSFLQPPHSDGIRPDDD
ncbi:MAG: RimK/LysX family protein [Acidimicrobiia bacterium]|nr:RimK/LysX family protein [Acidimicrobiia bacterium]